MNEQDSSKAHRTISVEQLDLADSLEEKILVCRQTPPGEVVKYAVERGVRQIVQDSSPHFDVELSCAVEMLDKPETFFSHPMATLLTPDSVSDESEKSLKLWSDTYSKSDEKDRIVHDLGNVVSALARPQSLVDDVRLVADELFTNSLYNAPGAGQSGTKKRNQAVELVPGKSCTMKLGKSDSRLVLICEDMFGSLRVDSYLNRMLECYRDGVRTAMRWGDGGAGIGCYLIFESCMSLSIGVQPGVKTLVASVFALDKGIRARHEISKSIHYVNS
ncbi:MAG: hypothetical protein AB7F86_11090 [Bdellovibrionales bacterium]